MKETVRSRRIKPELSKMEVTMDGDVQPKSRIWRERFFWISLHIVLGVTFMLVDLRANLRFFVGVVVYESVTLLLLYWQIRRAKLTGVYFVLDGRPFRKWELVSGNFSELPHLIFSVTPREDGCTIYGMFAVPLGMPKWEFFLYFYWTRLLVYVRLIK